MDLGMPSAALWFQSPESWSAVLLALAASSLLGLAALFVVQLRRQVQAAWSETGRIYQRSSARFAAGALSLTAFSSRPTYPGP